MFSIYLLINEFEDKTYIGFTDKISRRINDHKNHRVKTTKRFGNFKYFVLEEVKSSKEARNREKYWKSYTGRKKLKILFSKM